MTKETISTEDIKVIQRGAKCGVRKALELLCPWGERYVRVEGGYMVFESETDYETWKNQK